MAPEERDPALLWDMRLAAEQIADLILATNEADFPDLQVERFAVERLVLVLGEAAARVSQTYRSQHSEVPWRQLQEARNLVAHNYGRKTAVSIYRKCRETMVPLSLLLGTLVSRPPQGEENRSL